MSRKRQEQRREQQRQQAQRDRETAKRDLAQGALIANSAQVHASLKLTAEELNKFAAQIKGAGWPAQRVAAPEPPPPVFSECVIGYRLWLVDALSQLRAVTMTKQVWQPGINTARCRPSDQGDTFSSFWMPRRRAESHPAPHSNCDCGLYAWNDLPASGGSADVDAAGRLYAFGAIAAWGDLQVHADGFRAEHACVVALSRNDNTASRVVGALQRIAETYRVPVVHVEALQAEAERHGTPLPAHVRPEPDIWTAAPWPPQIYSHTVNSNSSARRI